MSTITFENGTSVNFEGDPTPADIEEVAASLNIQPSTPEETALEDSRNVVQKVLSPIYNSAVTMAARPGQLAGVGIAGAMSKITGNKDYYNRALDATNQSSQVPVLGTQIKPMNQETPESVIGEGIGTIGLGMGSPVLGGAVIGAGTAMENNAGPIEVAISAGIGSLLGKGGEMTLKATIPIVSKLLTKYGSEAVIGLEKALPDYAKPMLSKAVTAIEKEAKVPLSSSANYLQSAIADATPAYNPKLIGTQGVKEGGIAIKGRSMVSNEANIEAGTELSKTVSYNPKATNLEKYQAVIEKEIPKIADEFDVSLKAEKVLRPPKEIMKVVKDAAESAAENSLLLNKADPAVVNYLRVAQRAIEQSKGTLDGEWMVKKALTQAYENAGGKFAGNKPLDQIHSSVNKALIKDMEKWATNTEVQASMKKMSNLYDAADTLLDKAKAEGGTAWERLQNRHPQAKKMVPSLVEGAGFGGILKLIP